VFWRCLREEAFAVARDPGALLILVVAVLAYGAIYPVPYSSQVVRDVPILVVDEDGSGLSRLLARMADAHPSTQVTGSVESEAAAEREIAAGRAAAALVIPRGFERDVMRSARAEVVAVCDATLFLVYKASMTGIAESTATLSAGIEIRRLESRGTPAYQAYQARAPLRAEARPLFNPTESYTAYVVPAVYVLILHQTLLIGIGLLQGTARERSHHARRMGPRHGPVGGLLRLAGRSVPYLVLYAAHTAFYFGVLLPWLGLAPRIAAATLAWFFAPFLLATIWLALVAGALFLTRESAMATVFAVSIPLVFSVGIIWPAEAMAPWVPAVVRWLPATSGVWGVVKLSQMGASSAEVWPEWSWLWTLAVIYFGLAWLLESLAREPAAAADAAPPM
jgi:ABC-2 type transport system permease protein